MPPRTCRFCIAPLGFWHPGRKVLKICIPYTPFCSVRKILQGSSFSRPRGAGGRALLASRNPCCPVLGRQRMRSLHDFGFDRACFRRRLRRGRRLRQLGGAAGAARARRRGAAQGMGSERQPRGGAAGGFRARGRGRRVSRLFRVARRALGVRRPDRDFELALRVLRHGAAEQPDPVAARA